MTESRDEERERGYVLQGKDEMNLADFPFASLRRRRDSRESFVYEGWVTGQDGQRRRQHWIVRGLSGIGLPTEYDERVVVALMAITASHGFADRKVPFSVYQVLQVMGLTDSKRDYQNIERSLERLMGVTIFAEGAFWDNAERSWVTIKAGFHLIEKFWLRYLEPDEGVREREAVPGYLVWSEDIWNSFQAGYIKNLDLRFYYSLDSPLARRLYRFLDKRMHYRREYEIDIFELAGRLGMTRYRYPSKVIEKLRPALQELLERGYLLEADQVRVEQYTRMRFVRSAGQIEAETGEEPGEAGEDVVTAEGTIDVPPLPVPAPEAPELAAAEILVAWGFQPAQARTLAEAYPPARIQEKVAYLLWEQESNHRRIRNPQGWLRRAIEKDYAPPTGYEAEPAAVEVPAVDEPGRPLDALLARYGTGERERDLWTLVLRDLKGQTTRATFQALFPKTVLLKVEEGHALVGVPDESVYDWLEQRLGALVADVLGHYLEAPVTLEYVRLDEGLSP